MADQDKQSSSAPEPETTAGSNLMNPMSGTHAPGHNMGTHAPGHNMGTHAPGHNMGTHAPGHNMGTHAPGHNMGTHPPGHNMGTHPPGHNMGTHPPGHNMGHGPGHSSHPMFFYISEKARILFYEWTATNWQTMLGSCIGIAVAAAIYEGLKIFRESLLLIAARRNAKSRCSAVCACLHLFQTILHVIQVTVSYCLMMIFMTFNIYLCAAVIGGAGVGYLLFGWKRVAFSDTTEHCH